MKFKPFIYEGQVYDLNHLASFSHEYIQAACNKTGAPEKRYRCIIEFSGHCFTKSPNIRKQESLDDFSIELHYELNTQKNVKETRIFCFERYQCSLQLPNIIKELDKRKCFFTSADDKFLTVEITSQTGEIQNYEIYFSLKKSNHPHYDVHIYINSAYIRSGVTVANKRKSIKLFTLLHNTLTGKRIKKPC